MRTGAASSPDPEKWTKASNRVLYDPTIPAPVKILYFQLVGINGRDLAAARYPKQTTLAAWNACSVRQVQRFLEELETRGFIRQEQRGKKQSNLIFLLASSEE